MRGKLKNIKPEQVIVWIGIAACALVFYLGCSWHADYLISLESVEESASLTEEDSDGQDSDSEETETEDNPDGSISSEVSEDTAVTVSRYYEQAAEAGAYILDLQEEYLEDLYTYGHVAGQEEAMLERIMEIQDELGELFNDSSFDSVWFHPQDDVTVTWECKTSMDYSTETIPVYWICTTDDGLVAVYVTAEYDCASGTFYDAAVYTTSVGAELYAYTESDDVQATADDQTVEEFLDDVESLIEQSAELEEPESEEPESETELPAESDAVVSGE